MENVVSSQHSKPDSLPGSRHFSPRTIAVLAVLFVVAGAALRAVHLDQPLLNFHPTRQYRSALIARACYYDHRPDVSNGARIVAAANRALQPAGEPPAMEWLACRGYLLLGRETLAVPRGLAASFWLLGAIPLYAVTVTLTSPAAALLALSAYVFLPYGVVASRAFQPDPLMTSAALWAVFAYARYSRRPSPHRLAAAAVAVALAALIKPMSVFVTIPAGIALALGSGRHPSLFALFAPLVFGLLPAAAYYGYGVMFGTLAKDQLRLRFVPSLLDSAFFWSGLSTQARRVFTLPVLGCAMLGTLLARIDVRRLLAGLWAGYAAFAVTFTYHMPTHDYYHLPFVALAGIALAALVDRLVPASRIGFGVSLAIAFALWGSYASWPRLQPGTLTERIRAYQEIGALSGHTTRAIFLDPDYGYPLMYHGEVSGDAWPNQDDLAAESIGGAAPVPAAIRFDRHFGYGATHFIVTDLASLAAQPDLRHLLATRATLLRQTAAYHVYRFVR